MIGEPCYYSNKETNKNGIKYNKYNTFNMTCSYKNQYQYKPYSGISTTLNQKKEELNEQTQSFADQLQISALEYILSKEYLLNDFLQYMNIDIKQINLAQLLSINSQLAVEPKLQEKLIEAGVNINGTNKYGVNSLGQICNVDLIYKLINTGVDIHQVDLLGNNLLFWISQNYNNDKIYENYEFCDAESQTQNNKIQKKNQENLDLEQLLKYLILEKDINIHQVNWYEENALFWCYRFPSIIKILIEKGININQVDINGQNILFQLCSDETIMKDNIDNIKLLIKLGIELNQLSSQNQNFITNSSSQILPEIFEQAIYYGFEFNLKILYQSLKYYQSNYDFMKLLITKLPQSEINVCCEYSGDNLLWWCYNYIDLIYLLIDKGINIHQVNDQGENILFECCGDYKVSKLFIDKGINIHQVNDQGENILFECCDKNLIWLLISKEINLNQMNHLDQSILKGCCQYEDILNHLLYYSKLERDNINKIDSQGENAMFWCRGNAKSLQILRDYYGIDMDIHIKNNSGYNLYYSNGLSVEFVKLLFDWGVDYDYSVTWWISDVTQDGTDCKTHLIMEFKGDPKSIKQLYDIGMFNYSDVWYILEDYGINIIQKYLRNKRLKKFQDVVYQIMYHPTMGFMSKKLMKQLDIQS